MHANLRQSPEEEESKGTGFAARWYFIGAIGVLLIAVASQFRLVPGRPTTPSDGSIERLSALASEQEINVLFVLIDTLRADHLGAYGYSRPTSQNIDRLAQSGIRFARVEAQSSWTKAY